MQELSPNHSTHHPVCLIVQHQCVSAAGGHTTLCLGLQLCLCRYGLAAGTRVAPGLFSGGQRLCQRGTRTGMGRAVMPLCLPMSVSGQGCGPLPGCVWVAPLGAAEQAAASPAHSHPLLCLQTTSTCGRRVCTSERCWLWTTSAGVWATTRTSSVPRIPPTCTCGEKPSSSTPSTCR